MAKIALNELQSAARDSACSELNNQGYTRVNLPIDREAAQAFGSLAHHAWDLPQDVYYDRGNRYRSLDRYIASVEEDGIVVEQVDDTSPYFQESRYNTTLGGVDRKYEQLPKSVSNDPGLYKIIAHHVSRLPLSETGRRYDVNLHVMRYCAMPDKPCDTSPAGFHKDGEKYIAVNILSFCGADGGVTAIADNSKNEVDRFIMKQIGEGYTIDDEHVWHMLTPVTVAESNSIGIRDILLFDFIPVGWQPTY